jgi:hypothetical protein
VRSELQGGAAPPGGGRETEQVTEEVEVLEAGRAGSERAGGRKAGAAPEAGAGLATSGRAGTAKGRGLERGAGTPETPTGEALVGTAEPAAVSEERA